MLTGKCRGCKQTIDDGVLIHSFYNRDVSHFYMLCPNCGKSRSDFIAADTIPEFVKESAFVVDHRCGSCGGVGCTDCGSKPCSVVGCTPTTRVELHHTAPKAKFYEDAERWPKVWLCQYHHRQWHQVMAS